jgi:hypothetical protein
LGEHAEVVKELVLPHTPPSHVGITVDGLALPIKVTEEDKQVNV